MYIYIYIYMYVFMYSYLVSYLYKPSWSFLTTSQETSTPSEVRH